ncbi:hypothetical protein BH11PSE4_BH11PSE4_33220 [soil metagenome]
MPRIHVNAALAAAALRDAATTLKTAIVVSAAAILSQAKADLAANEAAAIEQYAAFLGKLDALHDGILQNSSNAAALAVVSTTGTIQVDAGKLEAKIALIAAQIEHTKDILSDVLGSNLRNGIDDFAEQVGLMGRAFEDIDFHAGELALTPPFQFDQFFLETMADLGQRDWSDAATGRTS